MTESIHEKLDYDQLQKKFEHQSAVKNYLGWLLERCVLEQNYITVSDASESDVSLDEGKKQMNIFLNIKEVETLFRNKEYEQNGGFEKLEKQFFEFLSSPSFQENKNKTSGENSKPWSDYPKLFIERLWNYRKNGSIDQNLQENLGRFAASINNDPLRYIYEVIQNADDCEYDETKQKIISININDDKMIVSYPEKGMTTSDILAITTIGQSNKVHKKREKRIIGEKGIGFKTIFSVCEKVNIHSGVYHFSLSRKSFAPEWIEEERSGKDNQTGTELELIFKSNVDTVENELCNGESLFQKIIKKYGISFEGRNQDGKPDFENILKNCPIFFTNQLDGIVIRYGEDKSLFMKKQIAEDKKTVSVSYWLNKEPDKPADAVMTCRRYEKFVQFSFEEYQSHYRDIFKNETEYLLGSEIVTYPIVLLAPFKFERLGNTEEVDVSKLSGNIFTYLPTFTNIKAPFAIQIPYELNQDRSCMWISGMKGNKDLTEDLVNGTTKWNWRLFKETFVSETGNMSLLEIAYNDLRTELDTAVFDYFPQYQRNSFRFFENKDDKYHEVIALVNEFCDSEKRNIIFSEIQKMKLFKNIYDGSLHSASEGVIMFDSFVTGILKNRVTDVLELNEYLEESKAFEEKRIAYPPGDPDKYEVVLGCLGVKRAVPRDIIGLTNRLLDWDFENTIDELLKEPHSRYLPPFPSKDDELEEKLKKLKAIKHLKLLVVQTAAGTTETRPWLHNSDQKTELWLMADTEQFSGELGIYKESLNPKIHQWIMNFCRDGLIDGNQDVKTVWSEIWKKIYAKRGNEEKILCSYVLFCEVMTFFAEKDKIQKNWFDYTMDIIGGTEEERADMRKNLITLWSKKYSEYREEVKKCP